MICLRGLIKVVYCIVLMLLFIVFIVLLRGINSIAFLTTWRWLFFFTFFQGLFLKRKKSKKMDKNPLKKDKKNFFCHKKWRKIKKSKKNQILSDLLFYFFIFHYWQSPLFYISFPFFIKTIGISFQFQLPDKRTDRQKKNLTQSHDVTWNHWFGTV